MQSGYDETPPVSEDSTIGFWKELAKKDLVDALNSVNGAKTLVIDSSLAGPLSLVTELSVLKQHGVDRMFWLEPGSLTPTTTNIVYLCRPSIKHIKIIADQIKRHANDLQKYLYVLLLVPRISTLVTHILEEEGVLGEVTITPYNLQFIPLAPDLLSLEADDAFRELWVDGDETIIYNSAQALQAIQKVYGPFPRIIGKGDYAFRLATLLNRQARQSSIDPSLETLTRVSDPVDSLIILDRRVDMITPFLTQLTYEGLIDEAFGIKNSHVELPASLLAQQNPPSSANPAGSSTASTSQAPTAMKLAKEKKRKHHLTASTDPLLSELRDLNFSAIGKKLSRVAHRLDEDYKVRHQAKTVAQLREFVGRLGGLQTEHQSLRLHTGISELLLPITQTERFNKCLEIQQNLLASYDLSGQITAIEDLIAQGADMQTVVRLLCLASLVSGGIKIKSLENVKREILQSYGHNLLPMLLSLAAPPLSVLLPNPPPPSTPHSVTSSRLPFTSLRKSLRLLLDDTSDALDEVENDISFVYSGYAPISVRLVQCVAQKGGVLSNPADKAGGKHDGEATTSSKVQAHPIIGWKGFEDVLATIPGETFDFVQESQNIEDMSLRTVNGSLPLSRGTSTTTIVFFLGGCTYTEIAALRWVARQNIGRKFLVLTTSIVSGAGIIHSIAGMEKALNTDGKF